MSVQQILSFLSPYAISILAFFAPIHTLLLVVLALIILDLCTGIWAAMKRGEKIKSAGIRRTVSKLLVYELAIIIGFLLQFMVKDFVPVANLAAGVIAVVEAKSLFENLGTIYGEDIFRNIITRIGSANDTPKKKLKKEE